MKTGVKAEGSYFGRITGWGLEYSSQNNLYLAMDMIFEKFQAPEDAEPVPLTEPVADKVKIWLNSEENLKRARTTLARLGLRANDLEDLIEQIDPTSNRPFDFQALEDVQVNARASKDDRQDGKSFTGFNLWLQGVCRRLYGDKRDEAINDLKARIREIEAKEKAKKAEEARAERIARGEESLEEVCYEA